MELKEFDILLDIKRSQRNEYIEVVQGDTDTNIFNIALQKEYDPYPLTGLKVEIAFSKPDGTTVVQDSTTGVTVKDAINGKISCTLKTNTIASAGRVRAEVRVLEGSKILTSTSFEFFVKRAIFGDDTIKSSNEWPLLSKLLEASNNEVSRVSNENTRISNENIRKANEISRVSEENKRVARFNEMESAYNKALEFSKEAETLEVVDARVGRKNLGELNREILSEINDNKLTPLTTNDYITSLPESLDGIMNIDKIEGNTLQNIVLNGDFSKPITNASGNFLIWTMYNVDYDRVGEGNILYVKTKAGLPDNAYAGIYQRNLKSQQGNIVFFTGEVMLPRDIDLHVGFDSNKRIFPAKANVWTRYGVIGTHTTTDTMSIYYRPPFGVSGETLMYRNIMAINLTKIFGAGNEPTVEWCQANLTNWFDGIQHFDGGVIKSVGVNSFDINGQYAKSPNTEYELKDNKLRVWNTQNADYRSVFKSVQLKPNTRYIISADRTKVKGEAQNVGLIGIKDRNGGYVADYLMSYKYVRFNTDNTGKVRVAFYSSANLLEQGEAIFSNVCIQEDPTNIKTEADYKSYRSDTLDLTPYLMSSQRNIFDGFMTSGNIDNIIGSGANTPDPARIRSVHFMEIDENLKYIIRRQFKITVGLRVYDSQKKLIQTIPWQSTEGYEYNLTLKPGAKYLRFIEESTDLNPRIQVIEVNENQAYKKELRRLPMGVADSLDASGNFTNRVGKVVLDGDEPWSIGTSSITTNSLYFVWNVPGIWVSSDTIVGTISDILPSITFAQIYGSDTEGFSTLNVGSGFRIRVSKTKLAPHGFIEGDTSTYVKSLSSWLASNNLTVYYRKRESIQEILNPIVKSLKSFEKGSLIVDSLISPYINLSYPTNLSGRVKAIEDNLNEMSDSTYRLWLMVIGLADKQLQMSMIQNLTTETNSDLKNKINEILTIWR